MARTPIAPNENSEIPTALLVDPARKDRGDIPCFACGRATRGQLWVHLTTYGTLVETGATIAAREDDQGWFPIGPECARKLPARFIRNV